MFFKEYVGEPLLNPPMAYPDMKTNYLIRITDLRHQPEYVTPKKIQLFPKYGTNPDNDRLFLILIRQREIEIISDANNLIEVKVI